jgi:AraC-like DNA-binding protein
MKGRRFTQWKGFEEIPQGCLLEQVVDLAPEMGFAYERSCHFFKDFHAHDRLMLIFPRGASRMEVRTPNPRSTRYQVDGSGVLIVPAHLTHDDEALSTVYDTLALYPSQTLLTQVAKDEGVPQNVAKSLQEECRLLKRSDWLTRLVEEYFYERVIRRKIRQEFFERQILTEIFRGIHDKRKTSPTERKEPLPSSSESIASRAVKIIESSLFEDLSLEWITRRMAVSVPTLLRHFRTEFKMSPRRYIQSRRLDEAMALIKSGAHSITETALLVGYENPGAFSEAFRVRFGKSPTHFRNTPRR